MKIASVALLAISAKVAFARVEDSVVKDDIIDIIPIKAPAAAPFGSGPVGDGCPCEFDYDCKPQCIKSYGQSTGFCGEQQPSPTPPSPTPPTEPTAVSDCCEELKTIPTKCEVQLLIELLDTAVSGDHKLAAQWLRGSFHDAGTFDQTAPVGGANGCLMNEPDFLNVALAPENAFLDVPVATLKSIKDDWEAHPDTCLDVSSADIIQFAGLFATVRQRGPTAGVMDATKESMMLDFLWGRLDETSCDHAWTNNLPGFSAGAGSPIPARCAASGTEIEDKMMAKNGFTAQEATALIGAHTIGLIRNTFGVGLAGAWVSNGEDSATPDGPVFDNAYHDFLKNTIVENTAADFATNTAPFNLVFPDWFRDSVNDLDHLDTDVALAFPPAAGATHPDYSPHTAGFAASNADFLTAFDAAFDKMTKLGVDPGILSSPTECCNTTSGGIGGGGVIVADVTTVKALVSNLGTAKARAEERLDAKQESEKLTEQRKKRTAVTQERVCDEKLQVCKRTDAPAPTPRINEPKPTLRVVQKATEEKQLFSQAKTPLYSEAKTPLYSEAKNLGSP